MIPESKIKVKSPGDGDAVQVVRRRPQHADAALLDAATRVFAWEGFAAAAVSRIAAEAGATKPTLYARFGSKAELYEATVGYQADAIRSRLFAAYDRAFGLPLHEAIRDGVDAWFAFAVDRPDGMRLLFGQPQGEQSPIATATLEAIIQRIAAVTEHFAARSGRSAGHAAPVLASMIVGACVHAIRRCLDDPTLDPDAVAALTTSFITAASAGIDPALYGPLNDLRAVDRRRWSGRGRASRWG